MWVGVLNETVRVGRWWKRLTHHLITFPTQEKRTMEADDPEKVIPKKENIMSIEFPDLEAPVSSKKYTLMHEYKETGRHGAWIRWVVEGSRRFFTIWCIYLQRRSYGLKVIAMRLKLWCMFDSHKSLLSLNWHHPPPHWKRLTHCRGCRGNGGERLFLGNVDSLTFNDSENLWFLFTLTTCSN